MTNEQLKEDVQYALAYWEQQRPGLEKAYAANDADKMILLDPAIDRLEDLIDKSPEVENPHTGRKHHVLEPNNYTERIEFIKLQKSSHYALVQLTMLYDETKKKAARLRVSQ